jgi:hypothetical protein
MVGDHVLRVDGCVSHGCVHSGVTETLNFSALVTVGTDLAEDLHGLLVEIVQPHKPRGRWPDRL